VVWTDADNVTFYSSRDDVALVFDRAEYEAFVAGLAGGGFKPVG